jgi:hypothetical protein
MGAQAIYCGYSSPCAQHRRCHSAEVMDDQKTLAEVDRLQFKTGQFDCQE